MTPDDLTDWVERSRTAQNLPERVTEPDAVSSLAELVRVAREAEAQRQAERRGQEPAGPTSLGGDSAAA